LPADMLTENAKSTSEEKKADRRGFLRYLAGGVAVAAAAAAGYYVLTPQHPSGVTTAATTAQTTALPTSVMPTTTLSQATVSSSATEIKAGLTVTSQAFGDGERIPPKHTCDGENISPPISWSGAPKETRSYALIMDDVDAPAGTFTHWVIFNVPATETGLEEDVPALGTLPNGATQGKNTAGRIGYTGPCPPSGTHRYVFRLFAIDTLMNLQPGRTKEEMMKAMDGHILAEAQFTGLYSRA